MSYERKGLVKMVLSLLLASLVGASVHAEESSRVWTNSAGKKVTGVMKGKGEDWVEIEIKGKVHKIKLASLSKEDQDYVNATKITKPLVVKTEVLSQKASDTDFDVRTVKLDIKNVEEGSEIYCLLVWVSQLKTSGGSGVKSHIESFIRKDETKYFKASFSNNRKVGESYRGFALRMMDMDGNVLVEKAEPAGYTKYLNEVRARRAPKAKAKKKED